MSDANIGLRASALLQSGRPLDACRLIDQRCASDDVDALYTKATWLLAGQGWSRDLAAARQILRQCVAIGHVDAALMEIALAANGSGGPVDWAGAVRLLDIAARGDPVAEQHRLRLAAMQIKSDGTPIAVPLGERLSTSPNVWLFRNFLTAEECRHLAEVAAPLLESALVLDPLTGREIVHPVRTAHSGAIGPAREDLVVRAINHRIAAISLTETDQGEPLTALHYRAGQQYRPHVDTIAGARNQRIKTVLLYLNHGYAGGQTQFSTCGLTIHANAGDAVMFDNVLADGTPDATSRHAGLPVTQGVKWLATRWIRAAKYDPWTAQ